MYFYVFTSKDGLILDSRTGFMLQKVTAGKSLSWPLTEPTVLAVGLLVYFLKLSTTWHRHRTETMYNSINSSYKGFTISCFGESYVIRFPHEHENSEEF